jgi:hypothetical protein
MSELESLTISAGVFWRTNEQPESAVHSIAAITRKSVRIDSPL